MFQSLSFLDIGIATFGLLREHLPDQWDRDGANYNANHQKIDVHTTKGKRHTKHLQKLLDRIEVV